MDFQELRERVLDLMLKQKVTKKEILAGINISAGAFYLFMHCGKKMRLLNAAKLDKFIRNKLLTDNESKN